MIGIEPDLMEVIRAVTALQTFVSNPSMSSVLDGPVADILSNRIEQRFASEGDEVSGPWAALKERTNAFREQQGFPTDHPINERTGNMKRWLTGHGFITIDPEGPNYSLPGDDNAGDPFLNAKLITAQTGTNPTTGGDTPRPVLGLGEVDAELVAEAIVEWFLATTAAFGVSVET